MSLNLDDQNDLTALGNALGMELATKAVPFVKQIRPDLRPVFFLALLAGPLSCAHAAMGGNRSAEVFDALRQLLGVPGEQLLAIASNDDKPH
jgi:hypothetical protein